MVYFAGDPCFSEINASDNNIAHLDKTHEKISRYGLVIANISSLEEKLLRSDLSEDKKKCYVFQLKGLERKAKKIQKDIGFW